MHMEQAIAAVRFDPALPDWLFAALVAFALLVLGLSVWRRAPGTVLRFMSFVVLLAWLSGPRLVEETRQTLPDIGLLVIDQTASMNIGSRAKLAEQARAQLEAQAHELHDLELRTITVPEGGNEGTRLFAAIGRALADIPRARLAGIVAVTDGQVHDIPATANWGAPLHVLIPAKGEETDRRIRIIEAPGYGIVGKSVQIRLAVDDLGVSHGLLAPGSPPVKLTVRRDGKPEQEQTLQAGRETTLDIPITRAGPTVIDLTADPLPGEVSTVNNRAVVSINGVRDRLRVLLVSGEPHAGERTWRRLLKSDPAVDLIHFTILRPPEKDDMTPLKELALIAFPVRELFMLKINEFDLIILDRFQNRGTLPLLYLRNIADYVREGGGLLVSAGPEFAGETGLGRTPLASVLPVGAADDGDLLEGPFRAALTALGTRHPVTAELPGAGHWGQWYRRIVPAGSHGEALMQGPDGAPLLLLNHEGEGRVAMLLSDQIWLWSRGHDGGGPQAELLRRVAHWLMKEPELEEQALTAVVDQGKLTVERRSTDDTPPPPVSVTGPEGATSTLALTPQRPGRATAAMPALEPGVWQVSDGVRTAYAAAGAANPMELADLRATATLLDPLVRDSGGSVHWLGSEGVPAIRRTEPDHAAGGAGWIGLQRRHDHLVTGIAATPLLPPWAALPLLLGLAVAAWRRESR